MAQLSQLGQTLAAAQNPNPQIQKQAEKQIETAQASQLAQFAIALCTELGKQSNPANVRQMAGLVLKNSLCGRSAEFQAQAQQRWLSIPPNQQKEVKNQVLQCLASPVPQARSTAAQIVGKIAKLDLPRGQWNDLVPLLVSNIKGMKNQDMAEACLQSLGFVCEECNAQLLAQAANQILDAIAAGMRKDIRNDGVKKAAIRALINSMDFIESNMRNDQHRNMIMTLVLECCVWKPQTAQHQQSACEIRMYAFMALYNICGNPIEGGNPRYYNHLTAYVTHIFQVTVGAMKQDQPEVAKQAIEFWSTCCDIENDIMFDIEDARESGQAPARQCHQFVNKACAQLVPVLLESLCKQADDIEDDSWTVAKAAGACLGLVANVVRDSVVNHTLQFIQKNIQGQHWRQREAAVVSFGLIMDGPAPAKLAPLVNQAFPLLLQLISDQNDQVKDSAAWTTGRVCEFVPKSIANQQILQQTMNAFDAGLAAHPKVASNICWAITNLAEQLNMGPDQQPLPTSPLSQYIKPLITKLLQRSMKSDADEANLLTSCYESINSLISTAPRDVVTEGVVREFGANLMQQLQATLNQNMNDPRVQQKQLALLGSMNGVVGVLATNASQKVALQQMAQPLMRICIQAIQTNNTTVHEEVFMIMGSIAVSIGPHFEQFMPGVKGYLASGLKQANQAPDLARVCLGTIGDISRGIGAKMQTYADELVAVLLQLLMDQNIELYLKPSIIECLSDLVLSLGPACDRYLAHVMKLVLQAGAVQITNPNIDMQETLEELRVAVLEICSATLQSLADANKQRQFLDYMAGIERLLTVIGQDKFCMTSARVLKNTVSLVGDMIQNCQNPQQLQMMKQKMMNPVVKHIVQAALGSNSQETKQQGQWCSQLLS